MPAKDNKTSVYRIINLLNWQVWGLGRIYVSEIIGKKILGRVDVLASNVRGNGLDIEFSPEPHNRHANITNWPNEHQERKLIAMQLEADSQPHILDSA
jgi:hypothetical protein